MEKTTPPPSVSASFESLPEASSSLSVKHLARTALLLGCVSFGAFLLNVTAWGIGSISILWPSTGLLIGILLCLPRRRWPVYIALGFVIDFIVNLLTPAGTGVAATFLSGCNVIEVSLAAWLLRNTLTPERTLSRPGQLIRFLAYGVFLASAAASFLASFYHSGGFGAPSFYAFQQWFTADALGISIVTPLYLSFRKQSPFSSRTWYEVTALFAFLFGASLAVFWQTELPLLFVILPILLLVEVRLGLAGSAIGLLVVSVMGGYATAQGHGPISLTRFASLAPRTLTLQFFTLVCMIVLYIMEVVLAERNGFELNLRASETRFRLLAEGSHDVILLQNLDRERQYVSPAVQKLLGWEQEEFISIPRDRLIHPDDAACVDRLYELCRAGRTFNTLDYRCRKADGNYLWMEANLVLHRAPGTGAPSGFINVLRDISSRKAAEEDLSKALGIAESLASIDALTGVANRRNFDEFFESEWLRAIRSNTPISMLMIDVDHFKLYNDRYGHVSGDNCLKEIARTIGSCIHRPTDLLARYGGEEFAVVLPNTDSDGAHRIAEQIRCAMEERQIPHEDNRPSIVTVSIGCATQMPKHRSSATLLLKLADEALYQAKSAGRNCVND